MEYGCIGEKLGHSFSKIIHNELADYNYELCEVAREDLSDFIKKADFKAINVTIPYKEEVIPFLYKIDDTAKKIGAVNTIVNKDGKLYGYNTDFSGLSALINREKIFLKGKKVIILGSGGTSKTAFAVAESMEASVIHRVSRSAGKGLITYAEAYKNHNDAQVIINTTPCGMYPNIGKSAIDIAKFPKLCGVVDAVYNPLDSALVTKAKSMGISAAGGLYMLVSQAAFAIEKFINVKIDISETERVYRKLLNEKRNLVLVGMPGCGKTTLGKALSKKLSKEFIDTDEEIVKKTGIAIPEIFTRYGEAAFRKIESEVIAEISLKQNCVIATGGGAVLNSCNVELLRENGIIIFIDKPLELIVTTSDRPLSSNRKLLEKRYNERYDIYVSSANAVIKASNNLNSDIKAVEEGYLNEIFSS